MLNYVRVEPETWSDFLSKTHNKVRFSTGRQSNYPLFANVKLLLKPLLRINCRERRQQFLTFQMWFLSGSYNHPKGLQFLLCVENLFPSCHIYYVKSCCPFMVFFSSGCCDATAIVCSLVSKVLIPSALTCLPGNQRSAAFDVSTSQTVGAKLWCWLLFDQSNTKSTAESVSHSSVVACVASDERCCVVL